MGLKFVSRNVFSSGTVCDFRPECQESRRKQPRSSHGYCLICETKQNPENEPAAQKIASGRRDATRKACQRKQCVARSKREWPVAAVRYQRNRNQRALYRCLRSWLIDRQNQGNSNASFAEICTASLYDLFFFPSVNAVTARFHNKSSQLDLSLTRSSVWCPFSSCKSVSKSFFTLPIHVLDLFFCFYTVNEKPDQNYFCGNYEND